MPLVSVVVPFFNVESYLHSCLVSFQRQTLRDLEVVLIDDGSPDASLDIAERFADADSRFRVLRQENAGLGPARNAGLAAADGEFVAFMDSDDVVAPRALEHLAASLQATGSDIAAGNTRRFGGPDGVVQSWTHALPFATTRLGTTLAQHPEAARDRMVWNKLYRRSFFEAQGFQFPAIKYEDYPVTLGAYLAAGTVDLLSEHVYYWRDRATGDSITQQLMNVDNALDRIRSGHMVLDLLDQHSPSPHVRARVESGFVQVDLVALAGALDGLAPGDRGRVSAATVEFALRLAPGVVDPVGDPDRDVAPVVRRIFDAWRRGDVDLAAALGAARAGRGARPLARHLLTHPDPSAVTAAAGVVASRVRGRRGGSVTTTTRRLRTHLVRARRGAAGVELTLKTLLRPQIASRATVSVRVGGAEAEVRRDGGLLMVDVPERVLVGDTPVGVEVSMRLGPLSWTGPVTVVDSTVLGLVDGSEMLDGSGVLAATESIGKGRLVEQGLLLRNVAHPLRVSVVASSGTVELTAAGTVVSVEMPGAAEDFIVHDGVLDLPALAAADPVDNPVTGVGERRVLVDGAPCFLLGSPAEVSVGAGDAGGGQGAVSAAAFIGFDGHLWFRTVVPGLP